MHLVTKINKKNILLIVVFLVLFLLTRFFEIELDPINPDAVNWHTRSEQFVVGLKHNQLIKTYQHYHPGVTLMWITGLPIELVKQVTESTYNHTTFGLFHITAKTALIIAQLMLTIFALFLLSKIISFKKAFFVMSLLSFEPFFIGNSRLYHMDIIFSLLVFCSLLLAFNYVKTNKLVWGITAGLFLALTFLTRSLGIGVLAYTIGAGFLFNYIFYKNFKRPVVQMVVLNITFALFTFALFPALWAEPSTVLTDIFNESTRVGVRKGHNQIFYEQPTNDPGIWFYPLVVLIKTSPFVIFGVLLYVLSLLRKNRIQKILKGVERVRLTSYLFLFYLGYFFTMVYPTKKLDRYMLVLYPLLCLLAFYGFYFIRHNFKNSGTLKVYYSVLTAIYFVFVFIPAFMNLPYLFTYTSPIFGDAVSANKIIGQKSFGVGVVELKEALIKNKSESEWPNVGMIDTKPLKAIYPNSKVFDIRVDGTSNYELLVLSINEQIPDDVLESGVEFVKDSVITINNLEYWTIYVKK